MIVVDTSVWIANLRNTDTAQVRLLRAIEDTRLVLVGDLILLEVLQGARDESHAGRLERYLRQFDISPMLSDHIAVAAARNYRNLRERGVKIRKAIDVIIGTFCLEGDHQLLHDDRDFDAMEEHLGLRVMR